MLVFIQNNDMVGLKCYFIMEVMFVRVIFNCQLGLSDLSCLDMLMVSGLIYVKYEVVNGQNVYLVVIILEKVMLVDILQIKVVWILGNLLDNVMDVVV